MNLNIVILNLNIFILYMSNFYECKKIYSNYTEKFINLAVILDYVYIGGNNSLIKLNASLGIVNIKSIEGSNWLLTPYKTKDEETILISCDYKGGDETNCIGYRSNFSIVDGYETGDIKFKKPQARYTTTTLGSDNVLTIASSDCLRVSSTTSSDCFAISNYKEKIFKFDANGKYTLKYLTTSGEQPQINLDFKTVVGKGTYTYFLFILNHAISKLGKTCNDIISPPGFNAYEDLPIFCSHNGVNFTAAQDLMFWNDDLLVVFTDETASVICKFTKLSHNYKTSRIERLRCPLKQRDNKYFKSVTVYSVCYNETIKKCQSLGNATAFSECPEMTNGFCSPRFFSSVEGDVPMKGEVIYYSHNSAVGDIVKMTDAIIVDEFVILYVGTSKGLIGKVFINNTDAFSLGDFKIVQWLFPVIDIKRAGENVYAMTKHVIANVADNADCNASPTCEHCMESKNPMCGWDIIKRSCNKNYDKHFWVPSAGKKCLTIKSRGIALHDNGNMSRDAAITFQLTPAIYLSELKYVIKINSLLETVPKDIEKVNGSYTTDNVNVSYSDTVVLKVANRNGTEIASTQVMLYKCRTATSCISCVQNRECSWCPLTLRCYLIGDGCNAQINATEESKCPKINNSKDLLIAHGTTKHLSVEVINFEIYTNTKYIKCTINSETYDATVFSNTALCQNVIAPNAMNKNYDVHLSYNKTRLDGSASLNVDIFKHTAKEKNRKIKRANQILPEVYGTTLIVYECQNLDNVDGNCGYCKYWKGQGYDCDWCNNGCTVSGSCSSEWCNVEVLKVFPVPGPESGDDVKITIYGKNIGNPNDNITVEIYGVECTNVEVLRPSSVITCKSGPSNKNLTLTISINENSTTFPREHYNVEMPNAKLNFTPNRSIIAGGRKIRITGENMFFGSSGHTYTATFCIDNNTKCIKCRDAKPTGKTSIMCRMDKSDRILTLTNLIVTVDKDTPLIFSGLFNFVENPAIIPLSPKNATVFRSGGIKITIKGKDFLDVGEVHVDNVENPCTISSDTSVVCETPPYVSSDFARRKRSIGQNIVINYDDYQNLSTIYYIDNPFFEQLPLIEYDKESTILIKGRNLLDGARKEDYFVQIGLDGRCIVEKISNENITCLPPKEVPRTNHSDDNTVFIMVKVGRIREIIGNLKYVSEIPVMTIVIAVLATAFVAAVVISVATVLIIRQRKIKAEENFEMELISREEKIRDASREEFADAQMTIRDIKTDLVTSNVPYFDYQSYAFHQLFPNQEMDTHRLLHEPMITDDKRRSVQKAMVMFDKLMTNKLFLKSLVQTLEHQNSLTLKDKANFASILSVAVLGNMRLFYELVSCLLSDMIQSASKKKHKVLFRRFESITQRLMVNWLEISLYDHLKDGSGMQLFMLYKATQTVIEKAPIDAVTGNSRNTLAEERLLKNRVEYETMTLNIDLNGNSDVKIPVSVLDCDTITQVKQKCITAMYKNKAASEIPTPHELELEWHQGKSGRLTLHDIDNISDRSNGMLRLNILKHYMVRDGNDMALMYKDSDDDPDQIYADTVENEHHLREEECDDEKENQNMQKALPLNPDHIKLQMPEEQDMHRWHLSNLTDEEKSNKEHEIGELFLNRLFRTKLILKDYIDAAFEGMMDVLSLPIPVRYFLCMLDKHGKDMGVDNDVLQAWKSECYGTRVWASLISKPQILFDVDVPSHVEPCMDILRQVFIDSFTLGTQNVSKESSTQKLLFYKDVAEYRKSVKTFFLKVEMVTDQEFWRAMDDMSTVQTTEMKFNRQATLLQLFNFISKYKEEIIEDFAEKDETKTLEFGNKLEEVVDLMES